MGVQCSGKRFDNEFLYNKYNCHSQKSALLFYLQKILMKGKISKSVIIVKAM